VRRDVPAEEFRGIDLPLQLPAQAGQEFSIYYPDNLDPSLSVALHDRRSVSLVFYTATGKRAKARVRYASS